jgi:hypothetical protein
VKTAANHRPSGVRQERRFYFSRTMVPVGTLGRLAALADPVVAIGQ